CTDCRVSMRGLAEPCGSWQLPQPSKRMGPCSNANGPRLSPWQVKQPGSLAANVLVSFERTLPCGL
ncbi:MAG TPA: hypothetical protein VMT39_00365, partial [Candidatus Bathyarchaeia archaeon]|nr:hypothetical protein [Candidatus Bathyarchaeia archaeon]